MPLIQSRLSHVSIDHSFLLINSTIPLHGCTRVYLNIYPLKGIWDYCQYFAIMKKVAMNIHIQGFREHNFSCFWIKCPGVQLVNHIGSTQLLWLKRGGGALPKSFPVFAYDYQQCLRDPASPHPHQHMKQLFYFSCSNRCVVITYCGSIFIFIPKKEIKLCLGLKYEVKIVLHILYNLKNEED